MRSPAIEELPPPPPGRTGWPWTDHAPLVPARTQSGRPWPRVSVVTPSYNHGRYIEETIRSVLLQGYPDVEYIVVDGCSTDESMEIIGRYEPWLADVVREPDRGQTEAINKGWRRSTGTVAGFLNADDFYLPGAIPTAASAFDSTPEAGMVYGSAMIVDEAGGELQPWKAAPFDLRTMLTAGNSVPQPAAFYSVDALDGVGYLDERWDLIFDYELAIRIGTRYPTVCIPATLARFRAHAHNKTRIRFDALAAELIEFIAGFDPDHSGGHDMRRMASSRVYYELSETCLREEGQAARALRPLVQSLRCYPAFALRRPVTTARIIRAALAGSARPSAFTRNA
jgi:glycosyltransferase involved in cell wall biosynthesis